MKLIRLLAIFFFDILDKFIHQKKIILFLKKKKIKIKFFIDVGAHKGSYTDLVLKNFKVEKIFMFEPQKKILKYAISDKNKIQKIYINRHDLTSSLTKLNESNSYLKKKSKLFTENKEQSLIKETYNVETIRLSNVLNKVPLKKIELLKIDTEGHELEVLLGLGKRIKDTQYILIEFHRDKIYYNYKPKKIHNYLIKNNFALEETFKFPFTYWEDRIYFNKKF